MSLLYNGLIKINNAFKFEEIIMVVTIKVNPINFEMKMLNLKGKFKNISSVVCDLVPVSESFDGKFMLYTYDLTQQQFNSMK